MRELHRIAYENVRAHCDGDKACTWKFVIVATPERLSRETKMFWRGLQVSKCTPEEKKALMHKLTICQMYSSCPEEIVKHIEKLTYELFLASDEPLQTRQCKRKWALGKFVFFISRLFRRNEMDTKPEIEPSR